MKPVVVVLAAGASRRLGTCKALVDLGGRSSLERLVSAAAAGGADAIHIVVGPHGSEIAMAVQRLRGAPRLELIAHPGWAKGRTGSLAAAARRLPGQALLVAPIDVPLVPSAVFAQLFRSWEQAGDPARGWLAPFFGPDRRFGHPLVLGHELAALVCGLPAGQPLKALRASADPLWGVEVQDAAILNDLDTPADLERLREIVRRAQE